MVEWLTLLLTLVSGPQEVEVAVAPPVAVVEILLDGTPAARLEGPPWRTRVDLGRKLCPHRLEAVAYGAAGNLLGRTTQDVNLPRSPAEIRLVVEPDASGRPATVRLLWEATTDVTPTRVSLHLDRGALSVDAEGRARLPVFDDDGVHILSAEVRFPGNTAAAAQAFLGGRYGSEVHTELTAVAVTVTGEAPPTLPDLASGLRVDGQPAVVAAVERPGPRLLVVVDPAAFPTLRRLGDMLDPRRIHGFPRDLLTDADEADPDDGLLFLVHPIPDIQVVRGQDRAIYPVVGPLTLQRQPLPWVVTHARLEEMPTDPVRLAEAVAAAGVRAAATARPRAVLLVLGGAGTDPSLHRADDVRGYLSALHVPLEVWSTAGTAGDDGWGERSDTSTARGLREAASRLQAVLDRQWIAWVEGSHPPSALGIADGAARVALVH